MRLHGQSGRMIKLDQLLLAYAVLFVIAIMVMA
jgi:hypothetical protein